MTRYAVVENGIVVNIATADKPINQNWVADNGSAKIGGTWDGNTFQAPAPKVPQTITMRQTRLALLNAGKLDHVDAAIATMKSPDKEQNKIYWEYSTTVDRKSTRVASIGGAMGLTDADIDNLFIEAAKL